MSINMYKRGSIKDFMDSFKEEEEQLGTTESKEKKKVVSS